VARNRENFDCNTCKRKHCDETGGTPGSIGPAGFPLYSIHNVIESRVCLLPMITPWSRQMLQLYEHYKAGHLVVSGGVLEQPAVYLAAMRTISAAVESPR